MASSVRVWLFSVLLVLSVVYSACGDEAGEEEAPSAVLTLDAANFSETIAKHPFVVVEFYAPWCGHCKRLEPEYEKAASILSKHDPPIVLAKVDANDEANKDIASAYEVRGFPTLKILRNEGKNIQDYKGPREADGIVEYLKKQAGPASFEIKSSEDISNLIGDKKIFIEFENYTIVAEKLRADYDFSHTSDSELLRRGDAGVKAPIVRLFKPFDELFVDFQDFDVDALKSFIETASIPVVTTFDKDPLNHPYLMKFFNNPNAKAMLFVNFSEVYFDSFKTTFYDVAKSYKGTKISFLLGDLDASKGAFQYFGLKEDQVPLILLQDSDGEKFLKSDLEPDQIGAWLKEYLDGNLTPFKKSEPIPEVNNEPVKVVVADSLHDVVFKSGKNVLLEFYAPWCGHCKELAPILDEVAVSLQADSDVIIAKMDATANDVPKNFDVAGYPTLYFVSATGKLVQYEGGRTAEDIINFIKENKDALAEPVKHDFVKDEL
ncbi:hypothetical protein HPP92_004050 [Vanilla planifolia]|uniref:Protein disulfide-isomerase n=1 Tax=Vanilla planifolia TaxID=51239 RepID=A0A835VP35_VANPL|nr:hypothetical protein HPP92_004050 [Vanilla planifolia]